MEKDDLIKPFSNITNFNYAIIIVLNLYSKITQNYKQIQKCICKLVQPIELTATINFVTRLQQYPEHYPVQMFQDIELFMKRLCQYAVDNQHHSKCLESPATKCQFCDNFDSKIWFEFKNPLFLKEALLYSVNGIGKILIKI
jgi:hypothetical protein